ncbi:serine protease [Allorhizocola rhizosphaerae]|uniref:serine protease n=1 Tax=Allorhizocola rhizosphaerae TaxID=1872709 RepID=UPI0013C2C9AD|nr:serine protease [Allorhizocola rhizosphaerae]
MFERSPTQQAGERHARNCAVSLWAGERYLGSGFFVAKQVIATCAHVVRRAGDQVQAEWLGERYEAEVLVRDPLDYHANSEPFPDIAFLGLTSGLDHPFVNLAEGDPTPRGDLTIVGFSRYTPERGVAEDLVTVEIEGRVGRFLKVKDGVLVHGLSGAPVVDKYGQVIGMAKARAISYDASSGAGEQGGWLVPASEIRHRFKRHEVRLKAGLAARPTLLRPDPGSPLHQMLVAQRVAAARYPYRIAKLTHRPVPPLSMVYVEQRTQVRRELDVSAITPIQMINRHRHVLVVAGPGGGKSTLLQQLVALSAQWWLRDEPPRAGAEPELGPVVVLRVAATDLLKPSAWYESIARAVNLELRGYQKIGIRPEIFEEPPVPGAEWLILIDGLDEVLSEERRQELTVMLRTRVGEYGATVRFGVASRRLDETEFAELRQGLTPFEDADRLGEYQLRPFDDEKLTVFAHKWFRPPNGPAAATSPESFLSSVSHSRIRPLVEVPLMATIAAVVHEENPGVPLAEDRAGLYEQFVSWLLTRRETRPAPRDALIERVAEYGREAVELSEFLFSRRYECLGYLADRMLRDDRVPAEHLVHRWLSEHDRPLPYGVEPIVLREFLLSTGLLEIQGNHLQFIHLSIAEYLAAKVRVSTFDPERWLQRVAQTGPDSLGLFTAKEWVRSGNDLMPVVERLLPHDFDSVATLLQDGVVGDRSDDVIDKTMAVVRAGGRPPGRRIFRAILQRGRDRTVLPRLLSSPEVGLESRIEAAKVLLREGTEHERRQAADTLAELAYTAAAMRRGGVSERRARLLATVALAEAGDGADRLFAMQHLTHQVETQADDELRAEAISSLARIGERPAAVMALLRRCCAAQRPMAERVAAMHQLSDVLYYFDAIDAGDTPPGPSGPYAPAWALLGGVDWAGPRAAEPYHINHWLEWALADAIAAAHEFDPEGADDIVRALMRDRAHAWDSRARVASKLNVSGRQELARRAMAEAARDPLEPGARKVAAMVMFRDGASWRESLRTLEEWVTDPRHSLDTRLAALHTIAGELDDDRLEQLAADTGNPLDLRASAAVMRGRRRGDYDWVRDTLRAMAREHPGLSPAWAKARAAEVLVGIEGLLARRRGRKPARQRGGERR